jgi:hypothetical protein
MGGSVRMLTDAAHGFEVAGVFMLRLRWVVVVPGRCRISTPTLSQVCGLLETPMGGSAL